VAVKDAAKERIGKKKQPKDKPWFDEKYIKFNEQRNQSRQRWLTIKPKQMRTTIVARNVQKHAGLKI